MAYDKLFTLFLSFLGVAFSVSSSFCAQPSLESILIGYPSPALTELPNYLAVHRGLYAAEGLEVKFVRARSNILMAALVSKNLHYITSITTNINKIINKTPTKILTKIIKNN